MTRILLIEDSLGDAAILKEYLSENKKEDYVVHQTIKLSSGIEKLKSNNYDLLLLDLRLPDSSGLETIQSITPYCEKIPIIVFSGSDDEDLMKDAIGLGIQDYIVKGQYDSALLHRIINFAIERKKIENLKEKSTD